MFEDGDIDVDNVFFSDEIHFDCEWAKHTLLCGRGWCQIVTFLLHHSVVRNDGEDDYRLLLLWWREIEC